MKSEELIKNNALQNIEVAGKQKVVFATRLTKTVHLIQAIVFFDK